MTMNSGNTGAMTATINVTPMIDVLLVLLIIFMVIVPMTPRGESAVLPRPAATTGDGQSVVLEVLKGQGNEVDFRINSQPVSRQALLSNLTAIFANRAERVLFVKGDDQVSFTQIAQAIDIGRAAGVDHIGLLTPGVQPGR